LVASAQISPLNELQREFDTRHLAVLRGLLSEALLTRVLSEIERADWLLHRSELKTELVMVENRVSALLHFLMHDPQMFDVVQSLTGCDPIGRFRGRTYRMLPDAGHTDKWHTDLHPGRVAAVSINLSPEPFEDGALEMRNVGSGEPISVAPPLRCGDAVLFRIRQGLAHRVRSVQGIKAKTAFAGFFYTDRVSTLAFPRVGVGLE
jgi:hypothetical protein